MVQTALRLCGLLWVYLAVKDEDRARLERPLRVVRNQLVGGGGFDVGAAIFDIEDAVRLDVEVTLAVSGVERDEGLPVFDPQTRRGVVRAVNTGVGQENDAFALCFEAAAQGAEAGVGCAFCVFPVQGEFRRIGAIDAVADVMEGEVGVGTARCQRLEFGHGGVDSAREEGEDKEEVVFQGGQGGKARKR